MNPDQLWHSGLFISVVFQAGATYMFVKALASRVLVLEARVDKLTDQSTKLGVIETKLDILQAELERMRDKLDEALSRK